MKRLIYLLTILFTAVLLLACSKDNDHSTPTDLTPNISTRAKVLGFENVQDYENFVKGQCLLGRHENCDVCEDGKHIPCQYAEHDGRHHSGTHHKGECRGNLCDNKHNTHKHDHKHNHGGQLSNNHKHHHYYKN